MNVPGLLLNIVATAIEVTLIMLIALGIAVKRQRHDGIDVGWGLGFVAVAVLTLMLSTGVLSDGDPVIRGVVTALTVLWGARLALHIYRRNRGKPEDPRYANLMRKATGNPWWYAFRTIYLTQGVLLWFVSLPVQAAQYQIINPDQTAGFNPLGYLGMAIWLIGMIFEVVGDAQLATFKADPANKGAIMDRGLWRYTRHPNYFGDACVWWGLYLLACQNWIGTLTILSPIVMTLLLVKGTGKALTEKTMTERPGYADYVRRTSGFLPLLPKGKS